MPAAIVGILIAAAVGGAHGSAIYLRALGDLCGATVFGLALLPSFIRLAGPGDAGVEARVPPTAIPFASAWALAAVAGVWIDVSERAGISPLHVTVSDVTNLARTGTGLTISACCAAAIALSGLIGARLRLPPLLPAWAAIAALGLLAPAVSGHLSLSTIGAVAVAVHVSVACWWLGTLAAMTLTFRGRRTWAQVLPLFSRWALVAVLVIAATGLTAGLLHTTAVFSAYGRVALVKVTGLVLLTWVGYWQRTRWLPKAASHGSTAEFSVRRASLETAAIAVLFGVAASLANTG